MPRFRVTSPDGDTITVEGEGPPTDEELDDIFAEHSLSKSGGVKFGQQQMAGFMQSPSTGFAGLRDPKALAGDLEGPPKQPRAKVPDASSSFGDILDWRERAVSERGGPEPQTPEETEAAGSGALTGMALAGGAAGAVKAAPYVWPAAKFAVKDIAVPAAIAQGLEKFAGAPPWLAEAVGGYGLAKGIRGIPKAFARRKAKQKAAEAVAAKAAGRAEAQSAKDVIKVENQFLKAQEQAAKKASKAGSVPKAPPAEANEFTAEALLRNGTVSDRASAEALAKAIAEKAGQGAPKAATDIPRAVAGAKTKAAVSKAVPVESGSGTTAEIVERIQTWKNVHKFSDGQILDSLAELYKIPRSQGKMLLSQF